MLMYVQGLTVQAVRAFGFVILSVAPIAGSMCLLFFESIMSQLEEKRKETKGVYSFL